MTGPVRFAATEYYIMPRFDGFTRTFLRIAATSIRQCTSFGIDVSYELSARFVRDMMGLLRHFSRYSSHLYDNARVVCEFCTSAGEL